MQLCIFEDVKYNRFEPLIYTRPVYDMICGINNLRKKILRAYPGAKLALHCRPHLYDYVKTKNQGINVNFIEDDDQCLFVNGRIIAPPNMGDVIPIKGADRIYKSGNSLVAARVSGKRLEDVKKKLNSLLSEENFEGIPVENVEINCADYVWSLIENHPHEIRCDYEQLMLSNGHGNIKGKIYEGAHLIEKDNIYIEEGAVIKPGAVLDASTGPIYIDHNAVVGSNSVLEGAIYIGENSLVKPCSYIYQNVSAGQTCKLGGEVEESIILPFSNKQHAGFLGHAYLGSWVNIGADTNNSDLKNNYSTVKVYTDGELVDSKLQFLGLIMGDHSKTAINTMFNTGTIIGFSCNVFGAGFPDKYLPSFSWGGSDAVTTYAVEKSLETAKRMLKRRNKDMNESEEHLFRQIFDLTKEERIKRGYPY